MRFGQPESYARHVRRQIRRSAVRETTEGADTIGEEFGATLQDGRVAPGHTSIALEAKDENHQRRVPLSPCKSVTGWR